MDKNMDEVRKLRGMLKGVTWRDFNPWDDMGPSRNNDMPISRVNSRLRIKNHLFLVKVGLHMQRDAIAIISAGNFIAFTYISRPGEYKRLPIIPDARYPENVLHLFTSDFGNQQHAARYKDGGTLELDELVLRELDE